MLLFIFIILFSTAIFAQQSTFVLSTKNAWWGDLVIAQGVSEPNSYITIIGNGIECNNQSDQYGNWVCYFNAPLELGLYNISVYINGNFANSTILEVKPSLGGNVTKITERSVYRAPMLIQEPNGKIKLAWIKITVWK